MKILVSVFVLSYLLPVCAQSQVLQEYNENIILVLKNNDQIICEEIAETEDDYTHEKFVASLENNTTTVDTASWKPLAIDTSSYEVLFRDTVDIPGTYYAEVVYLTPKKQKGKDNKNVLSPEERARFVYPMMTNSCSHKVAAIGQRIAADVQKQGRKLAPDYKTANCTEFLTLFLERHYTLTPAQKKQINVVLPGQSIDTILSNIRNYRIQPEYGGVCHFLEYNMYGVRIHFWDDLKEGDFIQWWWISGQFGHCGIVKEVNEAERWFSVYSSTPGLGFGITRYPIDSDTRFYFARITKTQKTP